MATSASQGRSLLRHLPGTGLSVALAAGSYWLATLPGLKIMGALTVALMIGILWRAAAGLPGAAVPGTGFTARTLLRLGIVLMGARLDFGLVAKAGARILFLDLVMIGLGLVVIDRVAKRLGVPAKLGMLLAVGTSVCGASAVVAAAPVTRAEKDDVTLAVALCGILGTVGVLFYVVAGPLLGLTDMQLAILSGSTLHEVAQVMAAAFTWGNATGDMGTLVKLTRVVLLAPALVMLGLLSGEGARMSCSWKEPPIPWFVIGFLSMGVFGSVGIIPAMARSWLSHASIFLMATAMAAMGLNTQLQMIRKAGVRVIHAGLAGFGILAVTAYGIIRILNIQ